MRIAPTGQRTAHSAQPVQPAASCSSARLRPASAVSHSTCGAQAATHQPQPLQRAGSMTGRAVDTVWRARRQGCAVTCGSRAITWRSAARLLAMTCVRHTAELGLNISR